MGDHINELSNLSIEELGGLRRMLISVPHDSLDVSYILEIKTEMNNRGIWHDDHCDVETPLPNCYICGRLELDQIDPGVPQE